MIRLGHARFTGAVRLRRRIVKLAGHDCHSVTEADTNAKECADKRTCALRDSLAKRLHAPKAAKAIAPHAEQNILMGDQPRNERAPLVQIIREQVCHYDEWGMLHAAQVVGEGHVTHYRVAGFLHRLLGHRQNVIGGCKS